MGGWGRILNHHNHRHIHTQTHNVKKKLLKVVLKILRFLKGSRQAFLREQEENIKIYLFYISVFISHLPLVAHDKINCSSSNILLTLNTKFQLLWKKIHANRYSDMFLGKKIFFFFSLLML